MASTILTVSTLATVRALCTLDAVKGELGIEDKASDTLLKERIAQASSLIEAECGRIFARETLTEIFRPARALPQLWLARSPVASIASVVADGSTLVAGTDYEADPSSGRLWRLANDRRTLWCDRKITVVYDAGWLLPDQPGANLPANISRACILQVRAMWGGKGRDATIRSESTDGVDNISYFDPGKLADDVLPWLDGYRLASL